MDWEHKGQPSAEDGRPFEPPRTWTDFCQAYLDQTMPPNIVQILVAEFRDFHQKENETVTAYSARWSHFKVRWSHAVKRHFGITGSNSETAAMSFELRSTEHWRAGLRPQIEASFKERNSTGTFSNIREEARKIEANIAPNSKSSVSPSAPSWQTSSRSLAFSGTSQEDRRRKPHKAGVGKQGKIGAGNRRRKECTYRRCKRRLGHNYDECSIRLRDEQQRTQRKTCTTPQQQQQSSWSTPTTTATVSSKKSQTTRKEKDKKRRRSRTTPSPSPEDSNSEFE